MDFKNNVVRLLESRNIPFTLHGYDYDAGIASAVQVAAAIGLPPERVFKTLVALPDQPRAKPMLVIVPGPTTLDLKALAKATGHKKVKMATHQQAESLTRLQTGGISPLALVGRGFEMYLDDRAQQHPTIAVSAGERGLNVELDPNELMKLTGARPLRLAGDR